MKLTEEIERRRTFAIVSHPDAGKTTLTEKFLLFGGAINVAGAVKSNKIKKTATSDFMEIEKQRGISVATSVMGFDYEGKKINILDTPGHQDFSEDTYRVLTAVDSALMVIDSAKGVEPQTEKLMEVCRMRNTPIMTFINKLDRAGMIPLDILDDIEEKLQIECTPLSWPIGMGKQFRGVYNFYQKQLHLFEVPFYYIEYGMAQVGALQVWQNAIQDEETAVVKYCNALALGGTQTLPELFTVAGADFRFDTSLLSELVTLIEKTIFQIIK